jgi:hypothetical protein
MAAKVLVAKHSFTYDMDGKKVHVHGGAKLRSTHPIAKANPHYFDEARDVDLETPRRRKT